jgi:hypothetical protein
MSNLFPNLFNDAIAKVGSLLDRFHIRQFMSVIFIGFLILTTNTNLVPLDNRALGNKLNTEIHQDGETRPAAETDGRPGERLNRVVLQTKEAFKDLSELYPEALKKGDLKIQKNK